MPLVRLSAVQALYTAFLDQRLGTGAVQPMPAWYDTALAEEVVKLLREGRRDLMALLENPRVAVHGVREGDLTVIDPDLCSFAGANTPVEWEALCARTAIPAVPPDHQPLDQAGRPWMEICSLRRTGLVYDEHSTWRSAVRAAVAAT